MTTVRNGSFNINKRLATFIAIITVISSVWAFAVTFNIVPLKARIVKVEDHVQVQEEKISILKEDSAVLKTQLDTMIKDVDEIKRDVKALLLQR